MARTVIDLDDEIVEQAMRVYGVKTKAAAVRAAMEEGEAAAAPGVVRRHGRG